MPGYWLTINPADLNSPIVVILAGVALSCDELRTEGRRIRRVTAQMNPVAVAQFFHHVCTGMFDALLASGKGRSGIFGEVSG
jgi:Helitron helicase-like domain at N-terminus